MTAALEARAFVGYRRALQKIGIPVTIKRIDGVAPNATVISAQVLAIVRDYSNDSVAAEEDGFSVSKPGAITQGDRLVLVMADDLLALGFPLPLKKNDRIDIPTGDELNVVSVDPYKRQAAGAIELMASGVA